MVRVSVPEEDVDEILGSDKVLLLVHRFSSGIGGWRAPNRFYLSLDYNNAFFVLEDKLGAGLEGTIIVQEKIRQEPYYKYSFWEIVDWLLW